MALNIEYVVVWYHASGEDGVIAIFGLDDYPLILI